MENQYSIDDWKKECKLRKVCYFCQGYYYNHLNVKNPINYIGCDNICCPNPECKSLGFYDPRSDRKRACKFCGFWQYCCDIPGIEQQKTEVFFAKSFICNKCDGFSKYNWAYPWSRDKKCEGCKTLLTIESKKAIDDPNHEFHKIKEKIKEIHKEEHSCGNFKK